MIQGGDPTGTGSGGPGYSTRDKVPRERDVHPGVVAMAKAGNEPPGTAGSQFFVVTGTGAGLTPDYARARQGHEGHGRGPGDRQARRPGQWRHRHALYSRW